ncbi:OmpH-like outer membrane protein, putative [Citrifermentans bemidjiense Bem]|uniref:OmpH-like outer membrane protein, putative n=1 Tax=Citrifermentans bemidjiense (strain ATCC BAA-1014 / DSM 16622 / JCM 12645 / Bem) TaxID=404380 RepID=B5EEW7_CITBB|nr:OmpH family outer membrane protein [Citrifermentans bemidjiense]ACH37863.1 OmpH-like outer membrane protein, putative [Citrifermentans bemidjiense Bem]
MKRLIIALLVVFSLPLSALAADGGKFGSVDIQKVLLMSDAGKEAKEQLGQKAAKYEGEKNTKEGELKKLKGELESQGVVLNESARGAKERDYQQRLKEYQRFLKDAQDDLQAKNDEFTGKIVDEIVKVAQDFGRKNGYTFILVRNEIMIYLDPSADVTDEVLKAFNAARKK